MAKWRKQTLARALARSARLFPAQEALVIGGRRLTYPEVWASVRQVAAGLHALGVKHGDHVAVCMGNSIEWALCFYGAAAIGAVTVPVNTRFKAEELRYCLKQSDARLLVVADRFLNIDFIQMLREACPGIDSRLPHADLPGLEHVVVLGADVPRAGISWETLLGLGGRARERVLPQVSPDDVLLIQYTSGTTSYPKGVMLTHDNMLRNAACVCERFDLRAGDRYYSARAFYHVAGTTLSLLAALVSGACLLSSPHFEPGAALRLMSEEGCTHTSGNDTMFLMLLNHPDFGKFPLQLRGGWASAGPEVSRKVVERMGMSGLCQAYGLSETSPNVCMSRHDDDLEKRINGWAHLLEGVKARIVDTGTGKARPPGTAGEILVRGWSVMKGYYKMPEQTAKAIDAKQWLHTGDLGVMDGDGRLRFIARIKDVFRVGGENVAPSEVEEVLHQHPAIKQAQVVGVPDPRLTEVPAAYVILREGAAAAPEEIIAWSRGRMANFRVPRYLKIVDTFDDIGMTGSAKVQKNKLRAQALIDFNLQDRAAGAA
ncbi:MAG: fatty-acid--CoA ligase [Betaproteobacteria bacterium RIFCSPLOWO2_02_FULL_67_26]|nr:MAG: fatty-acid--CoA ligase [Betaproteobacteria bacterium RIFCSPLOWO2_02_FULL_67_26]